MSTQILWFTTRGAGVVSLILFSAVACLGLLAVARTQTARWPRFLTVELHRNLALLSIVFLAIHIVTAIVDPFTNLGIAAALVPLASSYRPLPVAFGVVSVYLVLAIIVTSLLRERIGHRLWRAIHWASYAAWPLAVEHTLTAGSDAFSVWLLAIQGASVLAVSAAARLAPDIGRHEPEPAGRRHQRHRRPRRGRSGLEEPLMEPRLFAGPPASAGPEAHADHLTRLGRLPAGRRRPAAIPILEASGLLGRGGAGFPVGRKWALGRRARRVAARSSSSTAPRVSRSAPRTER